MRSYCGYVHDTWFCHPVWRPVDFCAYQRLVRTNNDQEGYHRRLNKWTTDVKLEKGRPFTSWWIQSTMKLVWWITPASLCAVLYDLLWSPGCKSELSASPLLQNSGGCHRNRSNPAIYCYVKICKRFLHKKNTYIFYIYITKQMDVAIENYIKKFGTPKMYQYQQCLILIQ